MRVQGLGMGSGDHHYGYCGVPFLHHLYHHAQIHHEASPNQRCPLPPPAPKTNKPPGDFGYHAFGKSRIAYEFTSFMLLANNILLIGFHMLTGAKILNTLSDHSLCTVVFSVIATLMGIVMSLPRTLNHVSFMSMFSAACMALAILLFLIFAGIEDAPLYGYTWKLMAIAFFTTPPGEGVSFRASWLFRSAVDTVKECKIIFLVFDLNRRMKKYIRT
jgi:hypothetical protein